MPIKITPIKNKKMPVPKSRPPIPKKKPKQKNVSDYKSGGKLKAVPEGKKGLSKLPTPVRNKMGFMKKGGMLNKKGKK